MKLNQQKAVALLLALGIVIILLILTAGLLIATHGHYGTTSSQIKHNRAYYLAEAGVQYGLARCRVGNYDDFSFSEDGTTINIDIEYRIAEKDYQIQSRASY